MKKHIFISQPMRDRTLADILKEREAIRKKAEFLLHEELEVIDSMVHMDPPTTAHPAVWSLSESIGWLSMADIVVFGPGWYGARGCKIEHECAKQYGLRILEIDDL